MSDDELVEKVARAVATVNGETHRWDRYEDEAEAALAAVDLPAVRAEAERAGAAKALREYADSLEAEMRDGELAWGLLRAQRVARGVAAAITAEVESGVTAQDPS